MIETGPSSTERIAAQLATSLASTAAGLRQVESTVRASGFPDALGGYRQMRSVLRGQRLWSLRSGRRELEPLWCEVASAARSVAAVLIPFAEVMEAIGRLDESVAIQQPPASNVRPSALIASVFDRSPDQEAVLAAVREHPVARARLRRELRWTEPRLVAVLASLVGQGKIRVARNGRGSRIGIV